MTSLRVFCIGIPKARLVGVFNTLFFGLGLLQFIVMLKYSSTYENKK
jgi:hypothetical protein